MTQLTPEALRQLADFSLLAKQAKGSVSDPAAREALDALSRCFLDAVQSEEKKYKRAQSERLTRQSAARRALDDASAMTPLTPEAQAQILRLVANVARRHYRELKGCFYDALEREADRLDAEKQGANAARHGRNGPPASEPKVATGSDTSPLPSQSASVAGAATIAKPLFIVGSGDDNARGYLVATNVNGVRVAVPLHTDRAFNVVSDALETLDKRCRRYEALLSNYGVIVGDGEGGGT